jgi:DUF2934 family protein
MPFQGTDHSNLPDTSLYVRIRERAYELSEKIGSGSQLENWLQAEKEIKALDEKLQTDFRNAFENYKLLADIRFKLLTLVPTATVIVALLTKNGGVSLSLGLLGLAATLGIVFYELRNSRLYDGTLHRLKSLELFMHSVSCTDRFKRIGGLFRERPDRQKLFGVIQLQHDRGLAIIYGAAVAVWVYIVMKALNNGLNWLNTLPIPIVPFVALSCGALISFEFLRLDRQKQIRSSSLINRLSLEQERINMDRRDEEFLKKVRRLVRSTDDKKKIKWLYEALHILSNSASTLLRTNSILIALTSGVLLLLVKITIDPHYSDAHDAVNILIAVSISIICLLGFLFSAFRCHNIAHIEWDFLEHVVITDDNANLPECNFENEFTHLVKAINGRADSFKRAWRLTRMVGAIMAVVIIYVTIKLTIVYPPKHNQQPPPLVPPKASTALLPAHAQA